MLDLSDLTCRVCLNVEELMVSIYEAVGDSQSNLSELLEQCGGLKVTRFDNFPKYLCKDCTAELLIAAKFREKCSKSQQIFENIIQVPVDLNFGTDLIKSELKDDPLYELNVNNITTENDIVEEREHTIFPVEEFKKKEEDNFEELINHEFDPLIEDDCIDETQSSMDDEFTTIEESTENEIVIPSKFSMSYENDDYVSSVDDLDVHPVPDYRYYCDICGAAFHYISNLTKHFLSHSCEILFTCQQCNYPFSKEIGFFTHTKGCQGNALTLKYNTNKNAVNNIEKIQRCKERGYRPFICSVCSKPFKTLNSMQIHLKRHSGPGDLTCKICGKIFYEKCNLKVHMRTHTGEKPHKCITCGNRFSRVFTLKLHQRTHTGEKPYKCQYCGRGFAQKCDLTTHIRIHTGVRPHTCPICFKGCIKSSALSSHMKQKHPVFYFPLKKERKKMKAFLP